MRNNISINANTYWRKLKQRLKAEGNEPVTNCQGLKMLAADGKMRLTDVADTEQLFRLIQSIPSPKAEPFKLWLAQVASEQKTKQPPMVCAQSKLLNIFNVQKSQQTTKQKQKRLL
ncbi:hypothetical protein PBAC_16080 [Pedobacter glucosidilyticus]|nr:BRO family protein [Pedobacter glucosidilyticus]KHJ38230.1 hypothetical protein PBAC_16080 [Pedobacter glucosidilyticus]